MKKLQTQEGYYSNGNVFSKIVCLPDDSNIDEWRLVSDAEYEEWQKKELERMLTPKFEY